MFQEQVGVHPNRIHLIRGSGVNLTLFSQTEDRRLKTEDCSCSENLSDLSGLSEAGVRLYSCKEKLTQRRKDAKLTTQKTGTQEPGTSPKNSPLPQPATLNLQPATLSFVMVSRLLKDKGVMELLEAARIIKERKIPCRILLVGDADSMNPNAVNAALVRQSAQQGHIEWLGRRNDIPDIYRAAHVAVLPSYREGMPKSLIEAAASGLAILTTNQPGCRETVRFQTGLSAVALAKVEDPGDQTADCSLPPPPLLPSSRRSTAWSPSPAPPAGKAHLPSPSSKTSHFSFFTLAF